MANDEYFLSSKYRDTFLAKGIQKANFGSIFVLYSTQILPDGSGIKIPPNVFPLTPHHKQPFTVEAKVPVHADRADSTFLLGRNYRQTTVSQVSLSSLSEEQPGRSPSP